MYYLVGMARGLLLPLSSSSVCSSLTCVGSVPFSANLVRTASWQHLHLADKVSPLYMKFMQPRFRRLPTQTCPCGWRERSCGRPPRRRICIDILANLVNQVWNVSTELSICHYANLDYCLHMYQYSSLRCHLLFHFHSLQTFSACADDQCKNLVSSQAAESCWMPLDSPPPLSDFVTVLLNICFLISDYKKWKVNTKMCCPSSRAVCVFLSLLGLGLSLYALHVETQVHYLVRSGAQGGHGICRCALRATCYSILLHCCLP